MENAGMMMHTCCTDTQIHSMIQHTKGESRGHMENRVGSTQRHGIIGRGKIKPPQKVKSGNSGKTPTLVGKTLRHEHPIIFFSTSSPQRVILEIFHHSFIPCVLLGKHEALFLKFPLDHSQMVLSRLAGSKNAHQGRCKCSTFANQDSFCQY